VILFVLPIIVDLMVMRCYCLAILNNKAAKMKIDKRMRIHPEVNEKLRDLVSHRLATGHPVNTGKAIVADFISKAHKKECK